MCRQRDLLEQDHRDMAAARYRDPIVAETIRQIGFTVVCLLPLALCVLLLRTPPEPADDREVAELLIRDLISDDPLLLRRTNDVPGMDDHKLPSADSPPRLGESLKTPTPI